MEKSVKNTQSLDRVESTQGTSPEFSDVSSTTGVTPRVDPESQEKVQVTPIITLVNDTNILSQSRWTMTERNLRRMLHRQTKEETIIVLLERLVTKKGFYLKIESQQTLNTLSIFYCVSRVYIVWVKRDNNYRV